MQLTNISKLKIIHTPGKNLSVADMLSRSFTNQRRITIKPNKTQTTPITN